MMLSTFLMEYEVGVEDGTCKVARGQRGAQMSLHGSAVEKV